MNNHTNFKRTQRMLNGVFDTHPSDATAVIMAILADMSISLSFIADMLAEQ